MDIKIKDTTRAGILIYDLNDISAVQQMKSAQNIQNIKLAMSGFMDKLRKIRKYDTITDVNIVIGEGPTDAQIIDTEEYYRLLFLQCLEENEAQDVLELL